MVMEKNETFTQVWRELERHGIMEPTTVSEAEARRLQVVGEVKQIESQLANRNRTDAEGRRFTDRQYHEWRGRAVYMLNLKTRETSALKDWLRRAQASAASDQVTSGSTEYYLEQVARILGRVLERHGLELTSVEQSLVDEAKAHLGQCSRFDVRYDHVIAIRP